MCVCVCVDVTIFDKNAIKIIQKKSDIKKRQIAIEKSADQLNADDGIALLNAIIAWCVNNNRYDSRQGLLRILCCIDQRTQLLFISQLIRIP